MALQCRPLPSWVVGRISLGYIRTIGGTYLGLSHLVLVKRLLLGTAKRLKRVLLLPEPKGGIAKRFRRTPAGALCWGLGDCGVCGRRTARIRLMYSNVRWLSRATSRDTGTPTDGWLCHGKAS